MKIYIDFDRTLFDCDRFLGDFYEIVDKYQIPKNIFKDCQIQCKKKGFNPDLILEKVLENFNFDTNIYQEIDELLNNSKDYLYPDAISFLDYLKKHEYNIIILTRGNKDYQRKKIMNSNIDNYYHKLIVTMKHKGELNIDYQNSIFIDDNPKEIISILNKNPKKIISIQRNDSKYNDNYIEGITIVRSLEEITNKDILNN